MHGYIERFLQQRIIQDLSYFPMVGILGPRQCGKSTLARHLVKNLPHTVYLDLELPSDANKLNDPELYLDQHKDALVCLDEIQRKPELFSILRAIVDRQNRPGQILILGSASPDLLRQSSESLAGRIAYEYLNPFSLNELADVDYMEHWLKGGFPGSLFAPEDLSYRWRENYLINILERDIPSYGKLAQPELHRRFLSMCAHINGQVINRSKIGSSLGVSHNTVSSYLDIFSQLFLLRVLPPYEANIKKRIVKSPKIYLRDTGILHLLLGISSIDDLLGHPLAGNSWEAYCVENILSHLQIHAWNAYYYRNSNQGEIDLILVKGKRKIGVEFKLSKSPALSTGTINAFADLGLEELWIVAPVDSPYPLKENIRVCSLQFFLSSLA